MFLGIDVSKATLDAAFLSTPDAAKTRHKVFANTEQGHQLLLDWLQELPSTSAEAPTSAPTLHACLEATGIYGDALARALHQAGHLVSVVNPAAVRAFAKSQLKRTKTDKADAQLIARFCALHRPAPWKAPAPEIEHLQALVRRIETLQEMKQMEANRLEVTSCEVVQHSLRSHIDYLEREIGATKDQIKEHIQAHPELNESVRLLCSIPGIAAATAALILAELGEIAQFENARQVAAFAGLAPCLRESGSSVRGKPRLSKVGSPRLRKALFYPAMTALRCNPVISELKQRLTQAGKCKMLILGAAMRKLLVLAYGVLKSGQPFDAEFCAQGLKN